MGRVCRGVAGAQDKKLREAARHWALGGRGSRAPSADEAADLEAFGAPADLVAEVETKAKGGADFQVHDDCWPALELFLGCDTQWRLDEGRPIGLDFTAVAVVARAIRRRLDREVFDQLKTMEAAALAAWREINPPMRAPRCPLMTRR